MQTKPAIQSWTLWVNFLIMFASVVNELAPMLKDPTVSRTTLVVALINILLRYRTSSTIAKTDV